MFLGVVFAIIPLFYLSVVVCWVLREFLIFLLNGCRSPRARKWTRRAPSDDEPASVRSHLLEEYRGEGGDGPEVKEGEDCEAATVTRAQYRAEIRQRQQRIGEVAEGTQRNSGVESERERMDSSGVVETEGVNASDEPAVEPE